MFRSYIVIDFKKKKKNLIFFIFYTNKASLKNLLKKKGKQKNEREEEVAMQMFLTAWQLSGQITNHDLVYLLSPALVVSQWLEYS